MSKKLHLIGLLLLASSHLALAQLDREFWFAAPDISNQHREDDRPVRFRISTLTEPAEVRISMPANPSFQTRTISLAANSTSTVTIRNPTQYENSPPNQVLNKGFLITSTALVSAFYEVGELWNVDIFALKGRNALGQEFILPNQNIWSLGSRYTDAFSSVTLVATEDNTVVTLIPSQSVVGHRAQDTITFILNRGETYSNHSRGANRRLSLNGSIVTANKPIAVTVSDDSIQLGGCRDLAGDQLVPVGVLGEEHIVAQGALASGERLFITATQDSTQVFVNGNEMPLDTLSRGQTLSYSVDGLTYVRTSSPAYVMHYTGVGCEVGAALIPSINCKGSSQVGFTRSSEEEFYMTVLVRQGGERSFTLNNDALTLPPDSFVPVPGTNSEWLISSRSYNLSEMPARRSYLLRNEQFSFQLGILDGGPGTGTRYGYFSNFASLFIGDDFTLCTGAERVIVPKGEPGATYSWNDGSTNPTLTVRQAGDYWVSMTNASGCVLTDTLSVTVNPQSFLSLDSLTGGCEGDVVSIDPGVHASYEWSNGIKSRRLRTSTPGTYSVEVINANGCVDQDSIEVTFQEKHEVDLGPDLLVCPNVPVVLDATTADATSYTWQDGLTDAIRSEDIPQLYWVDVKKELCTVRDTLLLENHPAPEVPDILGTPVVCPGVQDVTYESSQKRFSDYQWFVSGGELTSVDKDQVTVSWGPANREAVLALLVVDSLACTSDTAKLPVQINTRLEPPLPSGDSLVCSNQNENVLYTVPETNGSVYQWVINGTEATGGSESAAAQLTWPGTGAFQLQVIEVSVTPDTVCSGISPALAVTVFTDSANISLTRVTTAPTNDAEIQVIWDAQHPSRFDGELQLVRRTQEGPSFEIDLAPGLESFLDFGLETSRRTYEYEISALNKCAEPMVTTAHESMLLTGHGDEEDGLVSLQWNAYVGWEDLTKYELWRKLDREEEFSWLRDLDDQSLSFADTLATDGFDHRYRILALGNSDTQFSWSNVLHLSFDHDLIIPNVFTPNGDGINDRFEIENIGLYENNVLEVFNRGGVVIHRSTGYDNGWEGQDVPSGLYFYRLTITNLDLVYNGTLTLLR